MKKAQFLLKLREEEIKHFQKATVFPKKLLTIFNFIAI
tara:strand:- start:246 stop:359 length:114 start_codon:yes stop_codon:yes gene_type:complete